MSNAAKAFAAAAAALLPFTAVMPGAAQTCEPAWSDTVGNPGADSTVNTLMIFDDGVSAALYVGGRFVEAGGVSASKIACWDGTDWQALDGGVSGVAASVESLAIMADEFGDILFVGGNFTTAGGQGASRIASWNGVLWSALGSGVDGPVFALVPFDDGSGEQLFVGGDFANAGGTPAGAIASWDGVSWSPVGTGVDGSVFAQTVFDDGSGSALYVAGDFFSAGGAEANRIARWDGETWEAVGDGLNGAVLALTVFDDGSGGGNALYAGGMFTTSGVTTVRRIGRWDGSSWQEVGGGTNSGVRTLAVFDAGAGPVLGVGGTFSMAGTVPAAGVAEWDGVEWKALDSGVDNAVFALSASDGLQEEGAALYVSGTFTEAGGLTVGFIAQWNGCYLVAGDFDFDEDVDRDDYREFSGCINGPDAGDIGEGCDPGDFDSDLDIDIADYAAFQREFTDAF